MWHAFEQDASRGSGVLGFSLERGSVSRSNGLHSGPSIHFTDLLAGHVAAGRRPALRNSVRSGIFVESHTTKIPSPIGAAYFAPDGAWGYVEYESTNMPPRWDFLPAAPQSARGLAHSTTLRAGRRPAFLPRCYCQPSRGACQKGELSHAIMFPRHENLSQAQGPKSKVYAVKGCRLKVAGWLGAECKAPSEHG
jgi:hypothetical protein